MQTATLERPQETVANKNASSNAGKTTRRRGASQKQGLKNKELGCRGEDAAANFLHKRGYDILDRNWECFAGEADIVAKDGDNIVFIEVKTRHDCNKGFPSEAVNKDKRDRYEKIAMAYLQDHDVADIGVRFDVVSIMVVGPDRALIRHHINAFAVA